MGEEPDACVRCRYSVVSEGGGMECHFGPPTAIDALTSIWPTVRPDKWCGKFKPEEFIEDGKPAD